MRMMNTWLRTIPPHLPLHTWSTLSLPWAQIFVLRVAHGKRCVKKGWKQNKERKQSRRKVNWGIAGLLLPSLGASKGSLKTRACQKFWAEPCFCRGLGMPGLGTQLPRCTGASCCSIWTNSGQLASRHHQLAHHHRPLRAPLRESFCLAMSLGSLCFPVTGKAVQGPSGRLRVSKGRGPWEDWLPGGDRDAPRLPYPPRGSRARSRCGRGAVWCDAVRREARHPQPQAALPRQAAPRANPGDPGESDPQPHLGIQRSPRRGPQPALRRRGSSASPVQPDRDRPDWAWSHCSPTPLDPALRGTRDPVALTGCCGHRGHHLWATKAGASGRSLLAPFLSLLPGRAPWHSTRATAGDFCRSSLTASRRSLQSPSTVAGGLRAALRAHQPVRTIPGGTSTRRPPPPFIIPAAVCHYTPPPPPRSFPLTGPAMCQWLAVHLPPRQYQGLPHLLAARKGDAPPPPGGRVKRAWLITQRGGGSAGAHCSPVAQRTPWGISSVFLSQRVMTLLRM